MYTYHIQDLLVSVDIRSPSGLSISTGCPSVRFPTLSCPTAAAALDTVCPREEGRQFGGNGPMVLPGSCCSKLGDMWAELMGTRKILWFLALHAHYTSWLQCATCHLGWVQVIWLSHNRPVCARNLLQNKMAVGNWRVLSGHVLCWSLLTYKLHQGHPEDG